MSLQPGPDVTRSRTVANPRRLRRLSALGCVKGRHGEHPRPKAPRVDGEADRQR